MNLYGAPPPYPTGISRGAASATTTADTQVLPAPGQGFALMITMLVVYNAHSTTGTGVSLKSGSTVIFGPIPAPSGKGGCVLRFDPPLPCNENEAFNFATQDAVTTVTVSAIGYRTRANQT